jgi:hypothetical protein
MNKELIGMIVSGVIAFILVFIWRYLCAPSKKTYKKILDSTLTALLFSWPYVGYVTCAFFVFMIFVYLIGTFTEWLAN